ncbi:hypothetical protein JOB18_006392 [Solea senegalensis]|uniref:Uncharacterized protein n=1 Tax=Solea senegalensis TaxID=28829 RepID=A0AAV6PSM6_SOLSE|nr:hypothetical protein JOB18_006392 [Solea senegalensis]
MCVHDNTAAFFPALGDSAAAARLAASQTSRVPLRYSLQTPIPPNPTPPPPPPHPTPATALAVKEPLHLRWGLMRVFGIGADTTAVSDAALIEKLIKFLKSSAVSPRKSDSSPAPRETGGTPAVPAGERRRGYAGTFGHWK